MNFTNKRSSGSLVSRQILTASLEYRFYFVWLRFKILIFLIKLSGMISLLANTSNKELRSILELLISGA
jgi:hypothetical protein